MRALPSLTLLALLIPGPAFAKDLRGRLGLGFSASLSDLPAISLKYGLPTGDPKMNIALQAMAGLDWTTDADPSLFAGGRLAFGVVAEDNMNLFLAVGGGYHSAGDASFARVQPAMGAEFFLFGLENLGLTAEWGLNVDLGSQTRLTTVGSAPAVQVHYYF